MKKNDKQNTTDQIPPLEKNWLFCHNLPTKPLTNLGRVLVTGASGYIGGRLVPELLARGYKVRVMVRADSPEYQTRWPNTEVVTADASLKGSLALALKGIDTAYYLIHSLQFGPNEFAQIDINAAINFRQAAEEQKIKRIIYLGGLGDILSPLSSHLQNRIEVAAELQKGSVSVTVLRAAIIIGSGSASYEIIYNLVKKLPVILIPHWAKNKCSPIAVRDVIKYLVGVLEKPETSNRNFDIGGRVPLTYERMMRIVAFILQKKRIFIPFFISDIRIYSYIASFLTPVPAPITQCLMEGLRNEVVCKENTIKKFLPFNPIPYKEAVVRAISREEQDKVYTRWSDAYPPAHELAIKLHELTESPKYTVRYSIKSRKDESSIFNTICNIGGKGGWFNTNWLWRLRGILDRILLGVGTIRGRKKDSVLKINDVIDFWRVEDLITDKRLLLRAEMKLPGKAWLEFIIEKDKSTFNKLSVIAYFETKSFWGKIYWFACMPFHHFIFQKLIEEIEDRS